MQQLNNIYYVNFPLTTKPKPKPKRAKREAYSGTIYEDASDYLAGCRNQYSGVLIGNNTRIYRVTEHRIAIRYHETDIITYYEDGHIELDNGGWNTVTTKERLNKYQDKVYIYQKNYVWYAGKDDFYSGMVL